MRLSAFARSFPPGAIEHLPNGTDKRLPAAMVEHVPDAVETRHRRVWEPLGENPALAQILDDQVCRAAEHVDWGPDGIQVDIAVQPPRMHCGEVLAIGDEGSRSEDLIPRVVSLPGVGRLLGREHYLVVCLEHWAVESLSDVRPKRTKKRQSAWGEKRVLKRTEFRESERCDKDEPCNVPRELLGKGKGGKRTEAVSNEYWTHNSEGSEAFAYVRRVGARPAFESWPPTEAVARAVDRRNAA